MRKCLIVINTIFSPIKYCHTRLYENYGESVSTHIFSLICLSLLLAYNLCFVTIYQHLDGVHCFDCSIYHRILTMEILFHKVLYHLSGWNLSYKVRTYNRNWLQLLARIVAYSIPTWERPVMRSFLNCLPNCTVVRADNCRKFWSA